MLNLITMLFQPAAHEIGRFNIVFDYQDGHGGGRE
jgi:hypothetical protein